jgi:transposase
MMDTYTQAVTAKPKRRYYSVDEKRRIVQQTLADGASVARIAQAHGVNANLVFNWRKLYQAGQLGGRQDAKLLPVRVMTESAAPLTVSLREGCNQQSSSSSGTIHIQLHRSQVRIEGSVDPTLLRVLLECLGR